MGSYHIHWTIWNITGGYVYDSGTTDSANITLFIKEECEHVIGYWVEDNLGNRWPGTGYYNTTVFVDNTPPQTTIEFGDPNGFAPKNRHWIHPDTPIYLNSTDYGCNGGVGDWTLYYRVWYNASWYGWFTSTLNTNISFIMLDLGLDSHCIHYIEWYAVDALGNTEVTNNYTVYLPPVPTLIKPYDGWFYRIGHTITMEHTEESGVMITDVHYFYEMISGGFGPVKILDSDLGTPGIQWDTHAFTKGDNVSVWVELTDDRGLTCRSPINNITFCQEFNPEPCVIIMDISEGWNLISIGVELDELGENYTASIFAAEMNDQAGEDIIKYIVRWNAVTSQFDEYVVNSRIGDDFTIVRGGAYYIYSTSPFDMEFHIVGDCPENETFDLMECWNLIGYKSMEIMNVGDFAQGIDEQAGSPVVQSIVKYDNLLKDYVAWYPGDASNKFQIRPGEAYWIFSSTDIEDVVYPPWDT